MKKKFHGAVIAAANFLYRFAGARR